MHATQLSITTTTIFELPLVIARAQGAVVLKDVTSVCKMAARLNIKSRLGLKIEA